MKTTTIEITPPKMESASISICGMAPLVLHKFSEKTRRMLEAKMEEGSRSKNKRARDPRDFDADCEAATYYAEGGWCSIPRIEL